MALEDCNNINNSDDDEDDEEEWFSYQEGMNRDDIPDSVEKVRVAKGVEIVAAACFYNGEDEKFNSLKMLKISKTVKVVCMGSFLNCRNLVLVDFSHGSQLEEIVRDAFADAIGLKAITLPSSLRILGTNAFGGCINLQQVTISGDSRLERICQGCFRNCHKLKEIHLGHCRQLTRIHERAFADCHSLATVVLPPCLRRLRVGAFKNGSSLTTVKFQSKESICALLRPKSHFDGCASLSNIELPGDVLRCEALWPHAIIFLKKGRLLGSESPETQRTSCVFSFLRSQLNGPAAAELAAGVN